MTFVTDMLSRIEDIAEFLHRIMFFDEACSRLSGIANRLNVRLWRSEKPHDYHELQRGSTKVEVWCGRPRHCAFLFY
ncbi:uncharacterized protein NPIL_591681 [Nephila pilipes]|uniref:Uncharacterized protein n=1 Tax=Nephila pilipes TaxID=299642 RepID=A0A8X6UPK7_NEPPI|nr:uncharacterized protein NPIL_591681 [Nephila pilipes]